MFQNRVLKGKVLTHGIAVIAIFFFGFLALGSMANRPRAVETTDETVISSVTRSTGNFYNIPGPEEKRYTTLGLVFASTTTVYDEDGNEVSSQEGIATMLLREAQKVGGEDILNLRIDENVTWIQSTRTSDNRTEIVRARIVTYTGSALAIRYIN